MQHVKTRPSRWTRLKLSLAARFGGMWRRIAFWRRKKLV
jgi:hypothetical protein